MPRKTRQQEMAERQALVDKINKSEKAVNESYRYVDKRTMKLFAYDQLRKFLSARSEEEYPERELLTLPEKIEDWKEALKGYEQQNRDFNISVIPEHMDRKQLDQTLLDILDLLSVYSELNMTGNNISKLGGADNVYLREGEDNVVSLLYKKIKLLNDYLTKHPSDEAEQISINDYGDVIGFLPFFGGLIGGMLGEDPSRPENPDAQHITYTGKFMGLEEIRKIYSYDPSDKIKPDKQLETDRINQPLFPHTPTVQDINQAYIGDCYFLSSLASIADSQPEKIREMMKDNGDGTVTVRFFYPEENKYIPFYVTVDKIVTEGQAAGSLWVQMMERAFAASGLMNAYNLKADYFANDDTVKGARPVPANINEIYRKNKNKSLGDFKIAVPVTEYPWLYDKDNKPTEWIPDLDMISGGSARQAFKFLLGGSSRVKRHTLNETDNSPKSDKDIADININIPYTQREIDAFEMLKKACENKENAVTAGTFTAKEGDRDTFVGVSKKHEYTVLGAEEHEIDGVKRCFIKLRNPHGNSGRTYIKKDNILKAVVNKDIKFAEGHKDAKNILDKGFCYVELTHFMKEFEDFTVAGLTDSTEARDKRLSANKKRILISYRKALREIRDYLDVSRKLITKDSDEYKAMKRVLDGMLEEFPKDYSGLRAKLAELKTSIISFNEHTKRVVRGKDDVRRNVKIRACEAMMKIIAGAENNKFYRPMAVLKNEAANKIIDEFLDKGGELFADKDAYNRMREAVMMDRSSAKEQLMRSEKFMNWAAKYPGYPQMFAAVKAGVRLKDFATENTFADRKNYIVTTVKSFRQNMQNRLGAKFKTEEKEYLDKQKADERAERERVKKENNKIIKEENLFKKYDEYCEEMLSSHPELKDQIEKARGSKGKSRKEDLNQAAEGKADAGDQVPEEFPTKNEFVERELFRIKEQRKKERAELREKNRPLAENEVKFL